MPDPPPGAPADPLAPVALDGSPAAAYASHRLRADGIARYFAQTRPLEPIGANPPGENQAGENETIALIAHFHVAARDPAGSRAQIDAARAALRRLDRGNGQMGTNMEPLLKRDYDMALKGLMPIAYRYRHLLRGEDFDFILDQLVPPFLRGGHPRAIEFVLVPVLTTSPGNSRG
jgi:hypothetical protein